LHLILLSTYIYTVEDLSGVAFLLLMVTWMWADFSNQSLQASVQRVHTYVQTLEEKLAELERKKK